MQVDKRNSVSVVLGIIVTFGTSIFYYPWNPDWVAHGFPIPWYFRWVGSLMQMYSTCSLCLLVDVIIWAFIIKRVYGRIVLIDDKTQEVFT